MLLEQKLKVKLTLKNKDYYEKLGYSFTKSGDYIVVNPNELTDGSIQIVEYKCDYCNKVCTVKWRDYITCRKRDIVINKDCCSECIPLKNKEIMIKKQELGILKPNENGYWTFRENRLLELRKFIDTHKHANLYNHPTGKQIFHSFRSTGESIASVLLYDFDLNPSDYLNQISQHFYNDFINLEYVITHFFIEKYHRFPLVDELNLELGIKYEHINKHGGIDEVKRKMNYNDENDLIDDSGFRNSSWFEYLVAQFLLKNNIIYKREQKPFPEKEGKFRSDFLFTNIENEKIYLELWGFSKKGEVTDIYNNVKNHKKTII